MDTRAGLDTEVRGKILCPRLGSNSDRPVVQPIDTILTELPSSFTNVEHRTKLDHRVNNLCGTFVV
jgi:hypothetical protein